MQTKHWRHNGRDYELTLFGSNCKVISTNGNKNRKPREEYHGAYSSLPKHFAQACANIPFRVKDTDKNFISWELMSAAHKGGAALQKVGRGGDFVSAPHSVTNGRKNEFYRDSIKTRPQKKKRKEYRRPSTPQERAVYAMRQVNKQHEAPIKAIKKQFSLGSGGKKYQVTVFENGVVRLKCFNVGSLEYTKVYDNVAHIKNVNVRNFIINKVK